jgi:hypothetical protein
MAIDCPQASNDECAILFHRIVEWHVLVDRCEMLSVARIQLVILFLSQFLEIFD